MDETRGLLGKKGARRSLAERIASDLRRKLRSDKLRPGDKLPTEHALAATHGVSRTVVREAIAELRAEGLVVARQGSGAFVADQPRLSRRLSMLSVEPEKLSAIIEILELRAAVESEAAALAAERCSPAELANIKECHRAVATALATGQAAEEQDFRLHLMIAESTHNRHFIEFFRFLGARTIPRAQTCAGGAAVGATRSYLKRIHQEHASIVKAIAARQPDAAREAMRAHLKGSQERYARLVEIDSDGMAP